MRGLSKRFVNHKGDGYKLGASRKHKGDKTNSVSFLQLWRYATWSERLVTALGAACGAGAALALVAAITLYSELTSLFVFRHQQTAPTQLILLPLFGGAHVVEGDRADHMGALVQDSLAFTFASFAVMAVQLSAAALSICLTNWAAQRHIARVRHKLLESVLSREMSWFDTETSLSFANTLNEDTERLLTALGSATAGVSYLLGAALAGAGAALAAGPALAGAGLLLVPLAAGAAVLQDKYQTRYSERESVASGAASALADEVLQQATTVRAHQAAAHEEARYRDTLLCVSKHSKDKGRWAGLANAGGWFFSYLLNAVVLAVGAWLLVRDLHAPPELRQYDAGVVVQVLFCTFMCAQNIALLQPHIDSISSARGAASTVLALLAGDRSGSGGGDRGPALGHIVLKGIGFSYPARRNDKVLKDFNLEIEAGRTVALVGASGSGKSSVLQLLLALYTPDCGTITVDGRDLSSLDAQHYRRSIGVVGQESAVFHMSVRDNITLGALGDVPHERVVEAAKLANAYDFIMKLPQGFDTDLGQITLSGGQKQRLSLTRALVRRPRVLLLDEPTAALDVRSERIVQDALDAAARGRTTVVVSHRLSTIRNADKIVVVSEGAVLEEGGHAELMAARGHYYRMVQTDHSQRTVPDTAEAEDDATEDDRDDVPAAFVRHSSVRESRLSSTLRSSCRLGSVTTARLPNALQGFEDYPELPDEPPARPPAPVPGGAGPRWWVLLRLNAPESRLLAGGALAALVVGGSMPVFALLFANIYEMFGSSSGEDILQQSRVFAAAFAFVAACCGVAAYVQGTLLGTAGDRLTTRLRVGTLRALLRDGGGVGTDITAEEASSRLSADCGAVQGAAGGRLGTSLQGISTMLLGGALSLAYSWRMALVSAAVLPVVLLLLRLEGRTKPPPMPTAAAALATNAVRYARTVRSLGCEDQLSVRYKEILSSSPAGGLLRGLVRGAAYGMCLCAPTLGYAVALGYGGYLVAKEEVPYHYVILVSEALIYGAWMLGQALAFAPDFGAAARAGARILELLNTEPLPTPPAKDGWELRGQITFENVTCSFGTGPVLRGVSFSVQPQQTLALVGPSGCGKSTILMLLLRLKEPDSGRILIDGVDIRDVNIAQLRRQLAIVTQEPAVFGTSIRENIAYGDRSEEPMDRVIKAARDAHAHDFIAALPQGYDTPLSASTLSGGQKQRISLARALLRDPRVLLLDEPTAALDVDSERRIADVLRGDRSRTQLVVAHRLATVRHADVICHVQDGVVAESGTHDELVRKRGLYYQLLQQQPQD